MFQTGASDDRRVPEAARDDGASSYGELNCAMLSHAADRWWIVTLTREQQP
jgi:hypothetical protein